MVKFTVNSLMFWQHTDKIALTLSIPTSPRRRKTALKKIKDFESAGWRIVDQGSTSSGEYLVDIAVEPAARVSIDIDRFVSMGIGNIAALGGGGALIDTPMRCEFRDSGGHIICPPKR